MQLNPFPTLGILLFWAVALHVPPSPAADPTPVPPFFAFENGVRFGSTEERAKALKEFGFDGVGSANPRNLPERLKIYDAAGLKIFSLYVGGKLEGEKGFTYDPIIAEAIRQLKGRDTIIELFIQNGRGSTDDDAAAFVREIADLAKDSGLKVVLYPHAGFYVDTLGDAVRIAKLSGRDNVGAMFNLCHFLKVEPDADLRRTLESAGDLLWRASTNGADVGGSNWGSLIQTLDRGTFDQVKFFQMLREVGFDGAIGLQCYAVKGDAKDNLKRSAEAFRAIVAKSLEE